jgi:hypothetical protein
LTLNQPLAPVAVADRTTVVAANRISGDEGIDTTGSFEVQHTYTGPPNPLNPTADIGIRVTVVDDNNGSVSDIIFVPNPGIETINVAIDTTPQVPRLEVVVQATPPVILDNGSGTVQGLQTSDFGGAGGEGAVTSERFLELVAYSPDNKVIGRYRLKEEWLANLRALFAKLPDGKYQIVLKRTDSDTERLVMEVYVRRGRVIDPSDDSEGTRDRPPTSEGGEPNAAVPLDENPLLVPVEEAEGDGAMNPVEWPAVLEFLDDAPALDAVGLPNHRPDVPHYNYQSLRWGASLAALAAVTGSGRWSRKVEKALEQADGRAWQRLRRAGRLGRARSQAKRAGVAATSERT